MENNLVCKTRTAALVAIDTIAGNMYSGTQRDALLAVKMWIEDNTRSEQNQEEFEAKIAKLFKKTEAEQKGWDWYCRGSKKVNGELVPAEPEDGAEWKCAWNAKKKM
jgi:fructosamine-3-kinase